MNDMKTVEVAKVVKVKMEFRPKLGPKLRSMIRRLLLYFLAKLGDEVFTVPAEVRDVLPLARTLIARHDLLSAPGTSGEFKRDRVFEQLLNTYPQVSPKHLYLAILLARL